jgi:amidase
MSPIGLGNDIGGSLRNPANACGIASIRPSAGRVPDAGYVPAEDRLLAVQLMNVQGPVARRVADVRLGLRILMGAHPRDRARDISTWLQHALLALLKTGVSIG